MRKENLSRFRGQFVVLREYLLAWVLEKVKPLELKVNQRCECLNIHEAEGYMNAILSWMESSDEQCHVPALSNRLRLSSAPCVSDTETFATPSPLSALPATLHKSRSGAFIRTFSPQPPRLSPTAVSGTARSFFMSMDVFMLNKWKDAFKVHFILCFYFFQLSSCPWQADLLAAPRWYCALTVQVMYCHHLLVDMYRCSLKDNMWLSCSGLRIS